MTRAPLPGISDYDWHDSSAGIVYLAPVPQTGNWHVHVTWLADGQTRDLTPIDGVHARLLARSAAHPGNLYVALSDDEVVTGDVYRVDPETGARLLVREEDSEGSYLAGTDLTPLVVQRFVAGGFSWAVLDADASWRDIGHVGPEDALGTVLDGFSADGAYAFLRDSRGGETIGLVRLSLADAGSEVLARDPDADIARIIYDPRSGVPIAYAVEDSRRRWTALTADAALALERLALLAPGDLDILDQSSDGRYWLIAFDSSDAPPAYFLYDRNSRAASPIGLTRPVWTDLPTVAQRPVTILNRDGTKLVGYLSLPPERKIDDTGKPDKLSPLVLVVHGGPWDRDRFGFAPVHQWLASRGYAVLSVNYRGSIGFGKSFVAAADGAWGTAVVDDLIDAARWAVKQKIAKEDRLALLGGAFGGYGALMAMARAADSFACAVSLAPPVDLIDFVKRIPASTPPLYHLFRARVGDPATARGRTMLSAQSPRAQVAAIGGAVLLAGGGRDPLVPLASLTAFADRLAARQVDIAEIHFPDEGHGLARNANTRAFFAAAEVFLGRCLDGRVEPVTADDIAGTSLAVKRGGVLMP
ncbi:MAG: S9 family peptidase, partial [Alphaproteobacteria bacterium]